MFRQWNRRVAPWIAVALLALSSAQAHARLDPHAAVEKAVELIKAEDYAFARTYLAPALIHPALDPSERSRAYYMRGYSFYAQALYVSARKDYARALEFNADNAAAITGMAGLLFYGQGTGEHRPMAVELFRQAAELGHANAQYHLGYAYLEGLGIEPDLGEAQTWLTQAAEAGNAQAMSHLALSYRAPYSNPPQPGKARAWYEKAHAAGRADALAYIGYMYQEGELGSPEGSTEDADSNATDTANMSRALEYFERAAAEGSMLAKVNLGQIYLTRDANPKPDRAFALFSEAAEAGVPAAQFRLGYLYETGVGVDADADRAEYWYEQAADAGLLSAQLHLVNTLLGQGTETHTAEAIGWLSRAAQADDPAAHNMYAWVLATSRFDTLRDGRTALNHARRAVAQAAKPEYLDTLAAVYAELGQFDDAINTQKAALAASAEAGGPKDDVLSGHLQSYQNGSPWRE